MIQIGGSTIKSRITKIPCAPKVYLGLGSLGKLRNVCSIVSSENTPLFTEGKTSDNLHFDLPHFNKGIKGKRILSSTTYNPRKHPESRTCSRKLTLREKTQSSWVIYISTWIEYSLLRLIHNKPRVCCDLSGDLVVLISGYIQLSSINNIVRVPIPSQLSSDGKIFSAIIL